MCIIPFVEGASGECTIPNFPSTGESATFAWNQNTQHLELVPERPVPSGLAPVDQAAFDRLVVGKRAVSVDDSRYYIEFPSAGRLVEYEPSARYPGSYRYSRTGPNMGTLTQYFDDGDVCTAHLIFTSSTTATLQYTCSSGERGGGDFRIE